jgi:hypothetical protein
VFLASLAAVVPFTSPGPVVASDSRNGKRTSAAVLSTADQPIADPSVLVVGDVAYAYGTNRDGMNVPVVASLDLGTWTAVGDALPATTYPAWAEIRSRTWAPNVIQLSTGEFVMYVSVPTRNEGLQCIAVLTSPSPSGPFVDAIGQPLFCGWRGGKGAIDPSALVLSDGRIFLAVTIVSYSPQLWSVELMPDGRSINNSRAWPLLAASERWEAGGIENPAMVADHTGWWLFYSGNWWTGNRYATGIASCRGPAGPCTKRSVGVPWLATAPGRNGPGGLESFTFNGIRYAAFHVWSSGTRRLRIAPLPLG